MEQKKKKTWGSEWTIITILIVLGITLFHDEQIRRSLLFGAPAANEKSESSRILSKTINKIEGLHSISAKINLEMTLEKNRMAGSGKYEELSLEAASGDQQVRLRCFGHSSLFRIHLVLGSEGIDPAEDQEENILDVVCDKNTLWTYTSIEGEKKLTELKLGEMAAILDQTIHNQEEKKELAKSGITLPCPLAGFPGLGGMNGLLRRLSTLYEFESDARLVSLNGKKDSIRAWRLTGALREDASAEMANHLLGEESKIGRSILRWLPSQVEMYIGEQDYFPYRIRYFSVDENNPKKRHCLVNIDFTDVYENHYSVVPENFVYSPSPGELPTAITRPYIERLIPSIEY